MLIVNINGPINAGKSTVSKLLVSKLTNARFIEVDDLLSDEEQRSLGLDFKEGIDLRLARLDDELEFEIDEKNHDVIIFAYPMSNDNYWNWMQTIQGREPFKCITLSPSIDVCLQDRGERILSEWEAHRIKELYAQGFANPLHSDLVIDNSNMNAEEIVAVIREFLHV